MASNNHANLIEKSMHTQHTSVNIHYRITFRLDSVDTKNLKSLRNRSKTTDLGNLKKNRN